TTTAWRLRAGPPPWRLPPPVRTVRWKRYAEGRSGVVRRRSTPRLRRERYAPPAPRSARGGCGSAGAGGAEFAQPQAEGDQHGAEDHRVDADDQRDGHRAGHRPEPEQQAEADREHAAEDVQPLAGDLLAQPDRPDDLDDAGDHRPGADEDGEHDEGGHRPEQCDDAEQD